MTRHLQFTDAPYRRSHQKGPRGYGSWAFQFSTTDQAFDRDLVGEVHFYSGTLTDARRAFKAAHAATAPTSFVAVLS